MNVDLTFALDHITDEDKADEVTDALRRAMVDFAQEEGGIEKHIGKALQHFTGGLIGLSSMYIVIALDEDVMEPVEDYVAGEIPALEKEITRVYAWRPTDEMAMKVRSMELDRVADDLYDALKAQHEAEYSLEMEVE